MALNTLPLNSSGYFTTRAQADLDLAQNMQRRETAFAQMMADMGVRPGSWSQALRGQITPDWSNKFGSFAEGYRGAAASTAGRGFGPSRAMRRMTFAPTRSEIIKQVERARNNAIAENQMDKEQRRLVLADASRNAAQYGYENRQPRERR